MLEISQLAPRVASASRGVVGLGASPAEEEASGAGGVEAAWAEESDRGRRDKSTVDAIERAG